MGTPVVENAGTEVSAQRTADLDPHVARRVVLLDGAERLAPGEAADGVDVATEARGRERVPRGAHVGDGRPARTGLKPRLQKRNSVVVIVVMNVLELVLGCIEADVLQMNLLRSK